jgi:HEAT repeat protein
MAYAAYGGSPNRARPAAARALAAAAKNLERTQRAPIVETLTDLLRDPWQAVNWAAARGLGDLGEPSAIAALEAFARSLSQQDQAGVNRIIDDLRARDKVDGSAQQKQIDDLRDKVRTLEQQLQTLMARLEDNVNID